MTDSLADAVSILRGKRVAVLTGAGVSTESGIPDYRGEGAPARNPMTIERFLSTSDSDRRRYWAGGELGWAQFSSREPNAGHRALAEWESRGGVTGIVTQNVDGLHQKASSKRVVELHGTGRHVKCLVCGQRFGRRAISERIRQDNPGFDPTRDVALGPDGDAIPADTENFRIPLCTVCGGLLRPDVVFFGEFVPVPRFRQAEAVVAAGEALLVAGSSLVVNSGIRLVERALRRGVPVVIVNRGQTKRNTHASVVIDGSTGDVLPQLVRALSD